MEKVSIKIMDAKFFNGKSAFVSFKYSTEILGIIRTIYDRHWHKELKLWEISSLYYDELLAKLRPVSELEISGSFEDTEQEIPVRYDYKTTPFKHQYEGFVYGMTHNRWLLADEQGLGKTKQAIDIAVAKKLECGYKHCLIVCGVNGLKWNWAREVEIHSNEHAHILGQRVKKGKLTVGGTKAKIDDLRQLDNINDYFIITNVESLRDSEISRLMSTLCEDETIGVVVIDEIHKCKNPSSQQGKGILKLKSTYRLALTGTPLMNTPLDLYIVLRWLGYESHAFYSFRNHYCIMGGFGGYEIIGYRHLEDLQRQLDSFMLRRKKEDVLDLPEKIFVDEYVEMTGKQEQIYKEISAQIISNIDKIAMSPNPLSELTRMRQATGYTGILSSTIQESAKLDRLEELVDEAVSNDQKVVIFSNWTQMTDVITERLSKYNGIVITGATSDSERLEFMEKFQTDYNCKCAIGTIGAMGTGFTLTAGTVVIFLDEPWNMALKEQAIDRCHRIGTKSNVTIYTLMCKNTIDERIHELVEKKGAMSDMIVDGHIVGNKAELLDFLLS